MAKNYPRTYATELYQSSTYRTWASMKQRCDNPKSVHYNRYGGRGITYPKKWENFSGFLEDMGMKPDQATIDRMDNTQSYSKENCRWATRKEQANNTSRNHLFTIKGITKNITEWQIHYGVKASTYRQRLYVYKWSIERSLTTPVNSRSKI